MKSDETLLRILYYDCAPYKGVLKAPISGTEREYEKSDDWLRKLGAKDLFTVRRGVLKFRGFKPRKIPMVGSALSDADFKPDFEQKGIDMRIGLDIASFSATRAVDRIALITGDTDFIPAMKHARINGLRIVLVIFPKHRVTPELLEHSDFKRPIAWP